jgi:sortase (surface protein transpeptidase)
LRNVRAGDRITVITPRDVLEYVVRRTRVVACYPFNYIGSAPKRFIVSAERSPDRRQ